MTYGDAAVFFLVLTFIFSAICAVHILLSVLFGKLARRRGYSFVKYFFICLFLGVIGYCWVAALQDKGMQDEIEQLRSDLFAYKSRDGVKYGKWICSTCNSENSDQFGQCRKCGRLRG